MYLGGEPHPRKLAAPAGVRATGCTPMNRDRDLRIRLHLALARRMAKERAGRGVPIEDLEGEAMLALCVAAEDFDPSAHPNVTFAGFASARIRAALKAATERSDAVGLPRSLKRAAIRCRAAADALFALGEGRPSTERIAEAAGLGLAETIEALGVLESGTPIELFAAMDAVDPDQARRLELVEEVLDRCSELGRQVLTLVGADGLTIPQAARKLVKPIRAVQEAHDEAALCVAEAFRRRGLSPATWAAAIA
jgi:DNA-directed RNA polymerase specialized sigma subunit